ncbi:MAG: hypothetical protein H7X80_01790 [bacterium]|nr:hypothetical protein [Candidatus Kapabacteria bacterium]
MRSLLIVAAFVLLSCTDGFARTVRTAHFAITLNDRGDASRVADALERAYRDVRTYGLRLPSTINVTIHPTTTEFAARLGASRMHIAVVRGTTVHLQPVDVLTRLGDIDRALTHELVHVALSGAVARLPRWLCEGLAMNVAGERHPVEGSYASTLGLDRDLSGAREYSRLRRAYGSAERLTRHLIATIGRERTLEALRLIAAGHSSQDAFRKAAAIDLDAWSEQSLSKQKSALSRQQR